MTKPAWTRILERFADGRKLCNCREAYYNDQGRCAHGCSSNIITAKHEIADRIVAEEHPIEFSRREQP